MRLELGARKIAAGDRDNARATRTRAGDVERSVADHDDVRGADLLLAEALAQPLADRYQAGSVRVVGAVRTQVEVDITIEARRKAVTAMRPPLERTRVPSMSQRTTVGMH